MNKKEILTNLEEIQKTLCRGASQSTALLRPSEKGEMDRVYLLGYVDGRLKQLIKILELDLFKGNKSEVKNET